jgi:DNA (cytosine-5)-methyltransferase 1
LSEIEPFPSAVLAHHYPDVPNLGDMTTLPERILSGEVEAPDVFCGGTPCQAFSVAGLRNSLDDARGNLSLTFVGIANAIDHVRSVRSDAPAIVFWENVPGVLSTKDNAFGCFLGALAGEDDPIIPPGEKWTNAGCVYGPQRAVAWRVLDAQYFGVAQRRRRVFVVASARDNFDPAAVLFEFDSVRRDIAPSRETGKDSAGGIRTGAAVSSHWDGDYPHPTLNQSAKGSGGVGSSNQEIFSQRGAYLAPQPYEVGNCLTARMHKGINSTVDEGQTPVISIHPHCIGRAPEAGPQGKEYLLDGSAYCMDSRGQPQAIAIQDVTPREKAQNGRGWNDDGAAYTVDTHATQGVAQPIGIFQDSEYGVAHYDSAGTLRAGRIPEHQMAIQPPSMAVRRLTPVECERLQGFPDNYTNIPWRKKDESPDGPRYKALGNSWAVPNVRWIGQRIQEDLK